jgi:hypothetical protein
VKVATSKMQKPRRGNVQRRRRQGSNQHQHPLRTDHYKVR